MLHITERTVHQSARHIDSHAKIFHINFFRIHPFHYPVTCLNDVLIPRHFKPFALHRLAQKSTGTPYLTRILISREQITKSFLAISLISDIYHSVPFFLTLYSSQVANLPFLTKMRTSVQSKAQRIQCADSCEFIDYVIWDPC